MDRGGLCKRYPSTVSSWRAMHNRCTNANQPNFKFYGARGVTVCERWRHFKNFLEDMGPRPPGCTLDRVDPNRGYDPSNCRWATSEEQHANQQNLCLVTFNGKTQSIRRWAAEVGLPYHTVKQRIRKLRWPVAEALTVKPRRFPRSGMDAAVAA